MWQSEERVLIGLEFGDGIPGVRRQWFLDLMILMEIALIAGVDGPTRQPVEGHKRRTSDNIWFGYHCAGSK